jgi:hypothetical protein
MRRGVVLEASPASPFEVPKAEVMSAGSIESQYLVGSSRLWAIRSATILAAQLTTTGSARTDTGKSRGKSTASALAPADRAPGSLGQVQRKHVD